MFIVIIILDTQIWRELSFLNEESVAAPTEGGSPNAKSHTVDAILMHHEIYNSSWEERGVQKNIKIQYLKGAQRFI